MDIIILAVCAFLLYLSALKSIHEDLLSVVWRISFVSGIKTELSF